MPTTRPQVLSITSMGLSHIRANFDQPVAMQDNDDPHKADWWHWDKAIYPDELAVLAYIHARLDKDYGHDLNS